MDDEHVTRRRVLSALGVGGLTTLGGCLGTVGSNSLQSGARAAEAASSGADGTNTEGTDERTVTDEPTPASDPPRDLSNVRGAVYLPYRAFNHYQMWDRYAPAEIARDLTYARSLGLNSLRVFVSYSVYRENPEAFRDRFDHFVTAAAERGIALLPVMFESIGADPTQANVARNAPVRSPGGPLLRNRGRWDEAREFVRWFTGRYADHAGVLAVEIMNEPGELDRRVAFVKEMLRVAREANDAVPLTVGCRKMEFNRLYEDAPLDVLQFHHNLPPTADQMRRKLGAAADLSNDMDRPIWLTEWQRTRVEPPDKMLPHYQSLADVVRDSDVDGDYFWQLMLNPAYNLKVRAKGRVNGVFNEDGSVYSTGDARALAVGDELDAIDEVRPEWVAEVGEE